MRYSRIAKRRKGRTTAVLMIILIGIIIYAIIAGSAGNMISKWIMPVLDRVDKERDLIGDLPSDKPDVPDNKAAAPDDLIKTITRDIIVPESKYYAIQLGAFDELVNAAALSIQIIERGAAGYIHEDGYHRVFAIIFESQADVVIVKEQLKSQSIDARVYEIKSRSLSMRITAEKNKSDAIEATFGNFTAGISKIEEITSALDEGMITIEQALDQIKDIKYTLSTGLEWINEYQNTDKNMQEKMLKLYASAIDAIDEVLDVNAVMG